MEPLTPHGGKALMPSWHATDNYLNRLIDYGSILATSMPASSLLYGCCGNAQAGGWIVPIIPLNMLLMSLWSIVYYVLTHNVNYSPPTVGL